MAISRGKGGQSGLIPSQRIDDHKAHQTALESASASRLYKPGAQKSIRIYVDTPQGRRTVGVVVQTPSGPIFQKTVTEAKHFYRRYNSWSLDAACLQLLPQYHVKVIRLLITDKDAIEEATLEDYRANGVHFNDGYGPQVRLDRSYFHRIDTKQPTLFGGDA